MSFTRTDSTTAVVSAMRLDRLAHTLFAAVILAGCSSVAAAQPAAPSPLTLKASDGIMLKATYFSAGKPGPGLVLLHQCNRERSTWTPLATQAAARGYHVIALDYRGYGESEGKRFENFQEQQPVIEEKWAGDVDAAFAWLVAQHGVDRDRIGAAGASCGVNQSVQLARRHPEVKTVALLSGGLNPNAREYVRQSDWMPVFAAASRDDGDAVNTMRWLVGWSHNPASRVVEFKAAGHGTDMFKVEKKLEPMLLEWFDQHLKNAPAKPGMPTTPSKPTVVEEFWTALTAMHGLPRALEIYNDAKRRDPKLVLFPESELNAHGYQRLQAGHPDEAVDIFRLNVEAYPRSANTYDSLSDAYLAAGKREEALKYAEKALEVLPKDTQIPEEFRKVLRESIEKKIRELR